MKYLLAIMLLVPAISLAAPDPFATVSLMNAERKRAGLPALVIDGRLTSAATKKSIELAAKGDLVHSTALPGTPWPVLAREGYQYSIAGENLALGFTTADEVVRDWMNSPSHRQNILTAGYVHVGVGLAQEGQMYYVTAYFGAPPRAEVGQLQTVELLRQLIALYTELIRVLSAKQS